MFARAAIPGVWLFVDRDVIRIVTAKPLRCRLCGAAHYWFVNRNGRTCCFGCAGKEAADVASRQTLSR